MQIKKYLINNFAKAMILLVWIKSKANLTSKRAKKICVQDCKKHNHQLALILIEKQLAKLEDSPC